MLQERLMRLDKDLHSYKNNESKMVKKYGFGESGKKCNGCKFSYPIKSNTEKRFWKCKHLPKTKGRGSDIRLKWDACGLFKEKEEGK